jgi:acetyl esterase/lipase
LAATGYPVAVPNYRLTPRSNQDPAQRHPMHLLDLAEFLGFVLDWTDAPCSYDASRVILIGHSCSAHMISSLFFIPMEGGPRVILRPDVLEAICAVVLSEGIYDLGALLRSFPAYREQFVEPAFGAGPYDRFSILNATLRHGAGFPWFLIHSEGDTLVDVYQTTDMHNHLRSSEADVMVSLFDVVDEHDAILESEKYLHVVKKFLLPSTS